MKKITSVAVLLAVLAFFAQATVAADTTVLVRYGTMETGPTLRFVDVSHSFGKTILDTTFVDFGGAGYHEVSVGVGRILHASDRGVLGVIGEVMKTTGDHAAKGEWYFQPLVFGELALGKGVKVDGAVLPYLPLTETATWQIAVDHIRLGVALGPVTVGGGYGGFQFGTGPWAHKPMVTVQVPGAKRFGAPEFWLQHTATGFQAQVRLTFGL
ncbi:MAG TPA: hypothetical protein VI953_04260 [Candidatus Paceibacterota bacterium]